MTIQLISNDNETMCCLLLACQTLLQVGLVSLYSLVGSLRPKVDITTYFEVAFGKQHMPYSYRIYLCTMLCMKQYWYIEWIEKTNRSSCSKAPFKEFGYNCCSRNKKSQKEHRQREELDVNTVKEYHSNDGLPLL